MNQKERIIKFDTLKVVCMIQVVLVHTLINSYGYVGQEMIRFILLCYTMPMFAFISGYFSKPDYSWGKNIRHLLIPCILFTVINDGVQYLVNPNYHFNWRQPGFAMWYLWALFVFRVSLPLLVRIPHVVILSFILSWVVGFFPFIGPNYSLSRIICFLPYFLIGYMVANNIIWSSVKIKILNYNKWGG